ncbi:hypothetical protein SS50377_25934 [Spironucleus salmonicida]|uniref:Uncharacterized protein n=1 Tax=Spironucleus salmonicida TaxID=348837 RepID=V6LS47_9EUKA|nr:hypothetical protein SS50377_25934 [Spironucleus salmonicida]|eukprot:EST47083.1 Hypothetical protein SS50377_12856 [Spironucleus salmonicida]
MFRPRYREMTKQTLQSFKQAEKVYSSAKPKTPSFYFTNASKMYLANDQVHFDLFYNSISAQLLRHSTSPGFDMKQNFGCQFVVKTLPEGIEIAAQENEVLESQSIENGSISSNLSEKEAEINPPQSGEDYYSYLEPGITAHLESDEFALK